VKFRRFILACSLAAVMTGAGAGAVGGCKSSGRGDDGNEPPTTQPSRGDKYDRSVLGEPPMPKIHQEYTETPLGIRQQPVAVAEGLAPLAYIFDIGGPVTVMDLTDKKRLAEATVGDRTLVRVDARNGVIAGRETLLDGPLPHDHRYAIYAEPVTENVFRRQVGTPPRLDK
jgi:hypothetical protein